MVFSTFPVDDRHSFALFEKGLIFESPIFVAKSDERGILPLLPKISSIVGNVIIIVVVVVAIELLVPAASRYR